MGTVRRVVMWVGLLVGTQVAVGQAPAPSISSLSVTSGITGTAMTINGANFGSSPGTVTFNSVAAGVSSWSSGSIGVTVPAAATSGNVVVSVNGVASNGVRFTVVPNISGLLVNGVGSTVGPVGATLTIQGTGFGATLGFSTATLNGIALAGAGVKPVNWSNSSIVAVIPSTASSGPVKVTVGGKASNLVSFAIGPVITGVAPGSGVAGSSVMLSGNGFGTGGGTVTFNGLAAVTTGWTDSSITSQVPRGATAGAVVVTVNGVASNGVGFTPTPVISGLSPASGVSGTSVQIQGSSLGNQQGTSTVSFNGVTAPVVSWSNSTIQVTAPGGGQSGPVVVAVNGVQSAGSVFTYTPVITGLVPNSALAQTAIQIQGSNFGQTQGTVTFNGVGAGVSHWSNTSITATVPGNATAGPVVVTVNGVASNGVGFTFPAPYTFSVSYAPDGNVLAAQDSVNGNWSYGYDDFNRLITATNSAPQQGYSYAYDRYGNRWQQNLTAGSGSSVMATFTGAGSASSNGNCYHGAGPTNQPDGYCYDAAGNMLWDGQHHYTYDGENRIIAVDGGQTASYVYDGGGQRIRKVSAAGTADYVYDLAGHAVTEVSGFGQWNRSEVYANGRHLATYNNGTTYFTEGDWLGTERARVLASGELVETCTSLPFGDALECNGSADPSPHHLTGKERDTESGLDYFGARYYANALGLFVTPDPLGGHYRDPQTLNKYAYVRNNPLILTDPTGLDIWLQGCGKDSNTCKDNYVGTTDAGGKFQRTHLTGDQTEDATLGPHGIAVTYDGKQFQGVWDTNKGENGAVQVAGTGALNGYIAEVNGNCGGTCVASGFLKSTDPNAGNITKALFGVLNVKGSGFVKNAGTDGINLFHPGAKNFRGHSDGDKKGIPSTHIPVDPKKSLPNNEWHIDRTFPYDGPGDWFEHAGCATHTICNPQK